MPFSPRTLFVFLTTRLLFTAKISRSARDLLGGESPHIDKIGHAWAR